MIKIAFIALAFLLISGGCTTTKEQKPKIAFTFDDGTTKDILNYQLAEWNQLILDNLEKHDLQAAFFVTGSGLESEKGKYVLKSWNEAGHKIGNHTYSHPNYNKVDFSAEMMKSEIVKNDSIIRAYSNFFPYFRFPYLNAGNTAMKRDEIRKYLKDNNYKNGYVTIDNSEWYINSRLIQGLKEDIDFDIAAYREIYIQHIFDCALYYDSLAFELTGRKINHTLLLHHNLTSALFLDDLIQHFKEQGWEIINADVAFADEIFEKEPMIVPAGESIIWSMDNESREFENRIKFPMERSSYVKIKMDSLGL